MRTQYNTARWATKENFRERERTTTWLLSSKESRKRGTSLITPDWYAARAACISRDRSFPQQPQNYASDHPIRFSHTARFFPAASTVIPETGLIKGKHCTPTTNTTRWLRWAVPIRTPANLGLIIRLASLFNRQTGAVCSELTTERATSNCSGNFT